MERGVRDRFVISRDPPPGAPGDLGWVVMAHGEVNAAEFGWDTSFEALVARIVADYAAAPNPACNAAWMAELDGRRAGCVFVVAGEDAATAKLRILLVAPKAGMLSVTAWCRPRSSSRAAPAIRGYSCGPTTHWSPRGGSICVTAFG